MPCLFHVSSVATFVTKFNLQFLCSSRWALLPHLWARTGRTSPPIGSTCGPTLSTWSTSSQPSCNWLIECIVRVLSHDFATLFTIRGHYTFDRLWDWLCRYLCTNIRSKSVSLKLVTSRIPAASLLVLSAFQKTRQRVVGQFTWIITNVWDVVLPVSL